MTCALEYGRFRHCVRNVTGLLPEVIAEIRAREERGFDLVALQRIPVSGASFDQWILVFKRLVTIQNINAADWE